MSDPRATQRPTDDQLGDVVRFIARVCLEVERGLRPPAHLVHFFEPSTQARWQQRISIGRFHGGPVQPRDIGTPRLSRLADDHVIATVVTRTEAGRWGALTLQLRTWSRRWHLADLQRLLAATHYRTNSTQPAPTEASLDDRLRRLVEERRMAAAAFDACTRRLAEVPAEQPGYQAGRDLVRWWRRTVGDLDREIVDLRAKHQARQSLRKVLRS